MATIDTDIELGAPQVDIIAELVSYFRIKFSLCGIPKFRRMQ